MRHASALTPHRPAGLRLANLVGGLPPLSSRWRFDPDELVASAVSRTGLDNLGPGEGWREGLQVLCAALEHEARLTPTGRFFARGQLISALSNRLRIEAEIAAAPEVLTAPITAPIVVLGLPRTGSTLLQTLLSLDDDNRCLWHWEAAAPAPAPATDLDETDPRVEAARRAVKLVDYLAPTARQLHPVGADRPTECVTLFTNSFASLELAVINWVPSYLEWCLSTSMTPHYTYYRRQLQLLQRHNRRSRWALKSPAHLFWVDEVIRHFPDVRLVQIHRDPALVLASYFNLAAVLTGIGSDRLDPTRLGPVWTRAWAAALDRADDVRRQSGVGVVDVHYDDFVRAPVVAVERLYEQFGLDVSPAFARRMHDFVSHDTYRSGRTLMLEDFGVSYAEVRSAFDRYCTAHGVQVMPR